MNEIQVGVLGATGTVGQKFISLLDGHPIFSVSEVVASERSAGKRYGEAVSWKQPTPIPSSVAELTVKRAEEPMQSRLLFSGLDSSVAGAVESAYAAAGHVVFSNSKNHRMDKNVPLIIPEINPDHFELTRRQTTPGVIITNSNCSTMFLAMALAPLDRAFGVEAVQVTTLQAISGAGYPGVASLDILGNVIPFIDGEEEKMESEPRKILGSLLAEGIELHPMVVSAACNRVPVVDGHLENVSVRLKRSASPAEAIEAWRSFSGMPQENRLPSAPARPIVVTDGSDRPQPALDLWQEDGMATVMGRVRPCPVMGLKFVIMGHNTVRGAAGAAILNAESYLELGYLGQ